MPFLLHHGPRTMDHDQGICTFHESNRALHSWRTACHLQPTQMRTQLKKEGVMCRARPSLLEMRRIFYQPEGTVQTLLQYRKLLDGGQEEKEGPALSRHWE